MGNKRGQLFIISAPAGTGKSTLVEMLVEAFPEKLEESCSWTTRQSRPQEMATKHYTFVDQKAFEEKIEAGAFLEHAKVFGNYYGTLKEEVERIITRGKHAILVIDTQGAMELKEQECEGVFIFISPPSIEELRSRLEKRRTESEEKIQERLLWAKQELSLAPQYDHQVVNDNLQETFEALKSIIIAEENKT